jgi:hypothetical protein
MTDTNAMYYCFMIGLSACVCLRESESDRNPFLNIVGEVNNTKLYSLTYIRRLCLCIITPAWCKTERRNKNAIIFILTEKGGGERKGVQHTHVHIFCIEGRRQKMLVAISHVEAKKLSF